MDLIWMARICNFHQYQALSMRLYRNIPVIPHINCMAEHHERHQQETERIWNSFFGDNDYRNRAFHIESGSVKRVKTTGNRHLVISRNTKISNISNVGSLQVPRRKASP